MSEQRRKKNLSISIVTMGCPKNLVDSEKLAYLLEKENFKVAHEKKQADVFIINTCGFIQSARQESIETILEIRHRNPGAFIAAVGCMSQLYKDEILQHFPEVDAVYGVEEYDALLADITSQTHYRFNDVTDRMLSTPSFYAYLKISEGCNRSCSFCTIPAIRGKLKSFPLEMLVREAKQLAQKGVKEIIVVSQDTVSYGYDLEAKSMLIELLRSISEIEGIEWIRLMYLYPSGITKSLIEEIATNQKIVKYFDIPFQHSEDRVLMAMQRNTTRLQLEKLFGHIRERIPEAVIRGTVMVGFPQERTKEFDQLVKFIEKYQLERVAVFPFSLEEKSPIYKKINIIHTPSSSTIKRRYNLLTQFLDEFLIKSNSKFIGQTVAAIIESFDKTERLIVGRTCYDAPEIDFDMVIESSSPFHFKIGQISKIIIDHVNFYRFYACFKKN
ncbi:MAG: 30S ribosomal protein S12 methylthiotransferase RimO [Bacteroidales bacterium]|nr:30S ribosomal protein S12 methylthiotransferase RimO [Bacteroidales bacterium]